MNERAEKIKEAARQIAGCDITVRTSEVEPLLIAGWEKIPAGTVVYADTIRIDGATKIYTKASSTDITAKVKTPKGWIEKTAALPNDTVKDSMLDSYITRTIIGARKE